MNQKIRIVGRGLFFFLALCVCLGIASEIRNAQGATAPVVIVNFNVPVDPGSSSFVASAVSYAIGNRASAIVIEMNTPGGLLSDMLSIINSITSANQSGIPTYTFVVPNGLAASAGSYIAMATNKIFMANGSEIGPSTPIVVGGTALEQNHTQAAMLSEMVSLADNWGRNSTAATDMVQNDEAFTASQAIAYHIADGYANSIRDMINNYLPTLSGARQVTLSESLYNQFLSAISDSTLDGILILLGIVLIVLDFFHPTIILTVAGAIALVIGLIGAEIIGASFLGYLILAIAAVLIILEVKLGHGFAMMIGVALGALGIFYLAQGLSYSPSPVTNVTILELSLVVILGIVAGLYLRWVIGPIRQRSKLTGPEALVGKIGKAVTDLKPDGEVRVGGVIWRATSVSGDIQKGESVKVRSMKNLALTVEKVDQPPST